MEFYSLDNFPKPKSEWSMAQKVLAILFTLGLGFAIWYHVQKKEKAAKEKIAESEKQAERAKLEKAVFRKKAG